MRLMFVHYLYADRGSAQDVHNYALAARALGHEVALYGPPNPQSPFQYSLDMESADAVIFIFEWTTELQYGDCLDLVRLVGRVPRERRVVIDCDGKYNDAISVVGDYNHPDKASSRRWIDVCDSLTAKIYQPTFHPLRNNVRTFFFHAYNPAWEVPLDFRAKEYGMFYVGHNWFRWRPMRQLLKAVEPVREQVGRIGIVGHGWASSPPWADPTIIDSMSRGIFHPVIYRPLFNHLQLVTCRTFETFAANTIPLFGLDEAYVHEIYGEPAVELVLPVEKPHEKILDMLRRPEYYAGIVMGIRRHLAETHSYTVRLRELIAIVES
jgi:hypothetical protein